MRTVPLLIEEETKSAIAIGGKIRLSSTAEISFIEQFLGITIRFVEIEGMIRVMLEIGDKTTHKDIREAIPYILNWRDELRELQSDKIGYQIFHNMLKTPTKNKEWLLELLSQSQERGISYANLAEKINIILSRCLFEVKSYEGKQISTEQLVDLDSITKSVNVIISAFNIEGLVVKEAQENITLGKSPFQKGYPVSRYKMIEILRTWRKSKQHIMVKKTLEKAKKSQEKKATGKV